MITTNFNPSVLTTQRNLNNATNNLNTALYRMSTGYRVNCAEGTYDMIKGSDYIAERLAPQGEYGKLLETLSGVTDEKT